MSKHFQDDQMERLMIYRWLSALFARELDKEGTAFFSQGPGGALLQDLARADEFKPHASQLQEIFQNGGEDQELSLAAEFGFLFHGAGGRASAPPFESVYTSPDATLFHKAEEDCRRAMEAQGLSVSETFQEPADHIAVQAEFMAYLAGTTAQEKKAATPRVRELLTTQHEFLTTHILNWLPRFVEKCRDGKPEGAYTAAAHIALTFIQEDHVYLDQILETL